MIQTFINGKQVFPARGKSIKITKENPTLTERGTYSLDIEFPLSQCANREVFGSQGRSEVKKSLESLGIKISSNGATIVEGSGYITKITDETVFFQLKTKIESEESFGSNTTFIDEIDIGGVTIKYNTESSRGEATNHQGASTTPVPASEAYRLDIYDDEPTVYNTAYSSFMRGIRKLNFGSNNWRPTDDYELRNVIDSIDIQEDGEDIPAAIPSRVGLQFIGEIGKVVFLPTYDTTNSKVLNKQWFNGPMRYQRVDAMQPSFKFIMERLFAKIGYTIDWSSLQINSTFLNSIYIANACTSRRFADILPHWTFRDLCSQLELLFQHKIYSEGSILKFTPYKIEFNGVEELEIIDEIEATIEEEESELAFYSTENRGYDMSDQHDYDIVDEEIMNSFDIIEFDSYAEAKQYYDNASTSSHGSFSGTAGGGRQGVTERNTIIFKTPEGYYCEGVDPADETTKLLKINHFAPLVRNEAIEEKTLLKISPVALEMFDEPVYATSTITYLQDYRSVWIVFSDPTYHKAIRLKLANERTFPTDKSVWNSIQGDEVEKAKKPEDRLQIFFFDGYIHRISTQLTEGENCCPFTDVNYKEIPGIAEAGTSRPSYSLALERSGADISLTSMQEFGFVIDTKVKHAFKFIKMKVPDVSKIYQIKGKRYLCEKIEYDITDDGVEPLMTGYFYEIDNS